MLKRLTLSLSLALVMLAGTALAADPTAGQIYHAAQSGHLAQAQQMIRQVLRHHPNSAKAHFVAAELDARAANYGLARQELAAAESLQPGLPFASARAVSELRRQIGETPRDARSGRSGAGSSHMGWAVLLIGGVILVWMIVRRRMAMASVNAYPGPFSGAMPPGAMPQGGPGGPMGAGPGYAPGGYPPGYGPAGGSGIVHNLGTGLAIGAGVAAGEELVGHLLNPGSGGGLMSDGSAGQLDPQVNADMGGNDFGVSDPGSWDDGSGGGGDGGWT